MRKEAGFEVMDHIILAQSGNEKISDIVKKNLDIISTETLADEVKTDTKLEDSYTKEWSLNGEDVTLSVKKILS